MAHTFLHKAAQACGIDTEHCGAHSMRKTFGYQYYKKMKDAYYLMKLFGHATQSQTLQYIGVEADEIRKTMEDFTL